MRERETKSLTETRALLECLEAYATAPTPRDALDSIFASLAQKIGAGLSIVVSQQAQTQCRVEASDDASLIGKTIQVPVAPFTRPRNITDLAMLGAWQGDIAFDRYSGVIMHPTSSETAIIVFRPKPGVFARADLDLVARLASLAAQAVRNVKLAAEKDLLSAAIAGSSSGFAIADARDPQHPLVYVNKAFEKLSGYQASEVLGENCRFLSAEAKESAERVRLREAVRDKTKGSFLLRNKRKDGSLFWNELTLFPVHDAAGEVHSLVATQTDVSPRIRASEERDRVRVRMERALAATEDAFLMLEVDGTITLANAAVEQFFPAPGFDWRPGTTFEDNWRSYLTDSKDLPGKITSLLLEPDLHALMSIPNGQEIDLPDGRSILLRAAPLEFGAMVLSATDITAMKSAQRLLGQRLAAIEAATDGIAIVDEVGRLIYLNSAASELMGFKGASGGLGQVWNRNYRGGRSIVLDKPFNTSLERKDLDEGQTQEVSGTPLNRGGAVIVARDVSEKLAIEAREEELVKDLIRLQRQEAIAQLTAGIAHDFNNLLSAINGSVTLIGMQADLPDSITPHLNRIGAAGTQAAKLVNRLLDIGAAGKGDGAFDLQSVLTDLPTLLQPSLPDNIRFEMLSHAGGLALKGDPGTLSQVLINLALNARDALHSQTGEIALHVSMHEGVAPTREGQLRADARYAKLTLHDTGDGMDAETAAQVFQPYFSTKGRQGTGLGLAMVAMQVTQIGGAIGLDSTPGEGTAVSVYWPLVEQSALSRVTAGGAVVDLAGLMLLVVDDDPQVSGVISDYLEAQGAEVAVCEDPRDAVEAICEDPESWSAVLTDYDMPQMNGGELATQIHTNAPQVPIFVITALARRLNDPRLSEAGVRAILPKPVDLDGLCALLAQLLQDE